MIVPALGNGRGNSKRLTFRADTTVAGANGSRLARTQRWQGQTVRICESHARGRPKRLTFGADTAVAGSNGSRFARTRLVGRRQGAAHGQAIGNLLPATPQSLRLFVPPVPELPACSFRLRRKISQQPSMETPHLWSAAEAAEGNLDNRRDLKGNPLCLSVASVVDPSSNGFTTEDTEEHRGNDVSVQPIDKLPVISSQPLPNRSACSRHPPPTSRRARSGLGLLGTDGLEPLIPNL